MLPGNERIETNLRLALALNGSYDDAIGISASDTELVKNLNNAGYAAWLQGDFVAARAYLSRAMEISDVYYDRAANNLAAVNARSEEHTSELQSLMRISYAVFCLKKKNKNNN